METENNIDDLRVASFSCYLKPIDGVDHNMFDGHEHLTDMGDSYGNNHGALVHRKSASGKRWFNGYTSSCSTKKAVYVQQSIKKEDQFTFPVMINPVQELPRMSIEVIGSEKMSILSWDAIRKSKESVIYNDMASETSDDLFEVENISRTGWQLSESRRLSRSTRFTPSEASIKWSVVKASAPRFSSVYSGYDEKQTVYNTRARTKIEPQKNSLKKLDNSILGCNSFKSVKVVEPVSRTSYKSKHYVS